jgi:hypothetical protein
VQCGVWGGERKHQRPLPKEGGVGFIGRVMHLAGNVHVFTFDVFELESQNTKTTYDKQFTKQISMHDKSTIKFES